jgi:hypothetical protein
VKIGFSVQGSTDRALIRGLANRWCPQAELIEGSFRGSTNLSLRREYSKIAEEFVAKGVDVMVFLTDCDNSDWRQIQRNERGKFPEERRDLAIHGVADRNIESWLSLDAAWLAHELGVEVATFRVEDAKDAFEKAIGISRDDKKEAEIASLVERGPLQNWIDDASFDDFYLQIRAMSQRLDCQIENLRDV